MNRSFARFFPGATLLSLCLVSCTSSTAQPPQPQLNAPQPGRAMMPQSQFGRVLIVSGGPNAEYTQYAIESNARYVAALTRGVAWRRVLFADGKPASRTVSTLPDTPRTRARLIASWILEADAPGIPTVLRAPTLKPITGSSSPDAITRNLQAFGASSNSNERQLVYFTGHGGPGKTLFGSDDFENTMYSAWGDDFSTRQLAGQLQKSKSTAPLVLVMVQCHSGGFANTMFLNGDPSHGVWNRDFCGFFASIPERQASGCTEQVNERNYQDFTTHFFAALSGITRDGRRVSDADYDGSGQVSLDEAYAFAQINDDSIDVPLSTSDAFLRHVFTSNSNDKAWQKTAFSRVQKDATPSQRAVLNGLSTRLGLGGENRVRTAQTRLTAVQGASESEVASDEWKTPQGLDENKFRQSFDRLDGALKARFPRFKTLRGGAQTRALNEAVTFLTTRPNDLNTVYQGYELSQNDSQNREVEEAQLLRFLRVARSINLERRLQREGTPAQKAVFARLRTSEGRGAF